MNKKNIVVHKTIIHYLNKETERLILTDFENTSNLELVKDFKKVFNSVLRNDFTRKAVFKNYNNNNIKKYSEEILYNDNTFIENSKKIAEELYEVMEVSEDISSGGLLIGLFSVNDEKQLGIFKVDFKKSYTKEIKMTDGNKFKMNIVKKDDFLPENMATNQSAIILPSGINDEYHLLVLDKKAEKEQLDSDFLQKFLKVSKIKDDSFKTKVFKESMDNLVTNLFFEEIKDGESVRSVLTQTLIDETYITPMEIIDYLIEDENKKDIIKESLEKKIDDLNTPMEIDSTWIEKKVKNRSIKTDTGFSVKAKFVDFEDPTKFSLKANTDGTVDITLKNISLF